MKLGEARAPEAVRLYAIGDIHGCIRQLEDLFEAIDADMQNSSAQHHRIITVGDYVDRGPDSRAVIEFLAANQKKRPLTCLRGNHDQRMLEFMDIPLEVGDAFLTYGGRELLQSYDVDPDTSGDLSVLARAFKRNVPQSHVDFLDKLALSHEEGDYFFCHAGIKPGVPLADQSAKDLIWIRDAFLTYQGEHPKVVVHGHTPRDQVDIQHNRINVDTECYGSGVLSCVVLEGQGHRILQARGEGAW